MRRALPLPIAAVALIASVGLATPASAATITSTVYADSAGWHTADTRPDGTLQFVADGGTPYGDGALQMSTPTSASKTQFFTSAHDGTLLSEITAIGYSTYRTAPTTGPALPALNIRLDRDGDGDVDAYLVYEPYQDTAFYGNDAVVSGEWQTWDAWHGGDSVWWSGQIPGCGQATPCTIDSLIAAYPDAQIKEDPTSLRSGSTPVDADFNGSFGVNQGSGNAGLVAAVDGVSIATTDGVDVVYDFEVAVVLTSKDDCKDGNWATSTAPVFSNQGQCVSYFSSGTKE